MLAVWGFGGQHAADRHAAVEAGTVSGGYSVFLAAGIKRFLVFDRPVTGVVGDKLFLVGREAELDVAAVGVGAGNGRRREGAMRHQRAKDGADGTYGIKQGGANLQRYAQDTSAEITAGGQGHAAD